MTANGKKIGRRQFLMACGIGAASLTASKFEGLLLAKDGPTSRPTARARLGMNLNSVFFYSTEWTFVDLFKMSQPWVDLRPSKKPRPESTIQLDAEGNPILSERQTAHTLMCRAIEGHFPAGHCVCEFEGQGKLEFKFSVRNVRQVSANRYEMEVIPSEAGIGLVILQSSPEDPVRDIHFWMPGFENAQSPFHPLYVERLRPFNAIRFMGWQRTNDSALISWSQRTRLDSPRQSDICGVAPEYMADLCNMLDADPWFCMPHLADDDFIRQFARLIKSRLKADRKIYVEWSNELWNTHFGQSKWVVQQATAMKIPAPYVTADRALNMWKIWQDVFGADKHRIVRVAAGQAGALHVIQQMTARLNGEFDAISCAAYFGPDRKDVLAFDEKTTSEDIIKSSIANLLNFALPAISKHKTIAENWSKKLGRHIPLIAYEGGQAIVPSSPATHYGSVAWQQAAWDCQAHPLMSEAYRMLLDGFSKTGGELFMAFSYASKREKFGSWGHLQYQDDSLEVAPKYAALLDWQQGKI